MLNVHEKMAAIFKQRLRANFEMDSQVFGDHHGSEPNVSYSEHTFQSNYTAKAE